MLNVYLQNKLMPLYVLADLKKGMDTLRKAEKNPAYWLTAQNRNLRKFVDYIYTIPFYRRRFDESGIMPQDIQTGEDLLKLPLLTKAQYREWLMEETANPEKMRWYATRNTAGTTGSPLILFALPRDRAAEIANMYRCALMQNHGYHVFTDSVLSTMNAKSRVTSRFPYGEQIASITPKAELIEAFNRIKPGYLYGNKTALLLLAEYAVQHNIALHPVKCVGSISEKLDENALAVMEKAFGKGRIFDIYGCTEVGNFAASKSPDVRRHVVWSDTHVINLIDAEDKEEIPKRGGGSSYSTRETCHYFSDSLWFPRGKLSGGRYH